MIADGLRRGACTRSARMRALAVHACARARMPMCCHAAVVHVQPRQTSSAHVLCASPSVCRNRRGALTDVRSESGRLREFHIHRSHGCCVQGPGSLLCAPHFQRILCLLAALPHARESIRVVEIVLKFASWHLEIAKFSRLQAQSTGARRGIVNRAKRPNRILY